MLNYRTSLVVFIIALSVLLLASILLKISWWWILLPVILFKVLTAWGSFRVDSGFYLPVITQGPQEKKVAITFDDGPHSTVTPELLDLLARHRCKATFFVIGSRISGNENIVRRIVSEGHLIGNHTWSHLPMQPFWSWKKLKNDLVRADQSIFSITGISTKLFRPPFGVTSPPYAKALKNLGFTVIGWSNRSLDTVEKDPHKISERVKKQLKDGDIILFHDTDEKILSVTELLLNHLAENGIKVVPLGELIKIKPYADI